MAPTAEERMAALREQLRADPTLAATLPETEAAIVHEALAGESVYAIAQRHGMSEEAVWTLLGNAARLARGQGPAHRVESGGLGSDTDPGVTGGYGDTGFGSIGNEPPEPTPEEPEPGGGMSRGDVLSV
ncbi:MAG: hypothetical protein QJR03_01120 [Sphaerobacter sp.]|nr:hypothetical protein [Sphaerobacter sp.]